MDHSHSHETHVGARASLFQDFSLKYIDPTYMIRAVPANASDAVYCTVLAQSAVHGAMAGLTGFTVGPVNGRHAWLPITLVTQSTSQIDPQNRMWGRLLATTGQPLFESSLPTTTTYAKVRRRVTRPAALQGGVQGWRAYPSTRPAGLPHPLGAPPAEHRKAAPLIYSRPFQFLRHSFVVPLGAREQSGSGGGAKHALSIQAHIRVHHFKSCGGEIVARGSDIPRIPSSPILFCCSSRSQWGLTNTRARYDSDGSSVP